MKFYDVIDKDLKYFPFYDWKAIIVIGIIFIASLIASLFYMYMLIVAGVVFILLIVFCFSCIYVRYFYWNKVYLKDYKIFVCNYKGKLLKEVNLKKISYCFNTIGFPRHGFYHCWKKCLLLYSDIEIYDKMEYESYWNDSNILIIQNPELISIIEEKLKEIYP